MLSVNEYLEQQELAKLYPWMLETEKKLKDNNVNPDEYLEKLLTERQQLNEMDPLSLGLGALGTYAAHKGYKALGGWDGIKSLAKTGWEGAKRTWGDLKAQHSANSLGRDRQALADLGARTGARVSIPTAGRADTTAINKLAHDAGNILNSVNATSDVVKNNPQVQNLVSQIQQALDGLQQLTQNLSTKPTPTPSPAASPAAATP